MRRKYIQQQNGADRHGNGKAEVTPTRTVRRVHRTLPRYTDTGTVQLPNFAIKRFRTWNTAQRRDPTSTESIQFEQSSP